MRRGWWLAAASPALLLPNSALAQQPVEVSAIGKPLETRLDRLVALMSGGENFVDTFTPNFIVAVPEPKFRALAGQLRDALGQPLRLASIEADGPRRARVVIAYERGTASISLQIESAAPYRITGLLVTGTTTSDDSPARLIADFAALPGKSGFGIYALGNGAPRPIQELHGREAAPLGSAFKLWILAELARQIAAGERRWSDVVPLGPPSLSSGITQGWPTGSPMTLHSLAALMISISDNSAADTLLRLLGREQIDAIAHASGAPVESLPILTTRELFVLKGNPTLAKRWASADLKARRAILAEPVFSVSLDPTLFGGAPIAIDSIEWFASPLAMARALDTLRRADPGTRAILAINPGADAVTTRRFDFVGFKGGAEPGVVTLNYLVRAKDGRWFAVAGNWHRTDGETPLPTFATLMTRALAMIEE